MEINDLIDEVTIMYIHFNKAGCPDRVLFKSDYDLAINEDYKAECIAFSFHDLLVLEKIKFEKLKKYVDPLHLDRALMDIRDGV